MPKPSKNQGGGIKMGKWKVVLPLLVVALILSACPPKEVPQIADAEQAIAAARSAQAEKYAPTKLRAAEEALAAAKLARKNKKYNEAVAQAELAKKLANEARQESLEAAAREPGAPQPIEAAPAQPPEHAEAAANYADIFKTVYFDFDKSDVKTEFRGDLDKAAKYLKDNPRLKVTIVGHCDPRGTEEYNMALGERRAKAVQDYLTNSGIAADRISIVSKGKMELLDTNCSAEECWAKERRGVFQVQ